MGSSASKGSNGSLVAQQVRHSGSNSNTSVDVDCFRAELLLTAYSTAWFGCNCASRDRIDYSSFMSSPMYDSDDEPTEPNGVVNALAVNSPTSSNWSSANKTRMPAVSNIPIMRSLSDPLETVFSAIRAQHPRNTVEVKHKHVRSTAQHAPAYSSNKHATAVGSIYRTSKQLSAEAGNKPHYHQHVLQPRSSQHAEYQHRSTLQQPQQKLKLTYTEVPAHCTAPWSTERLNVYQVAV